MNKVVGTIRIKNEGKTQNNRKWYGISLGELTDDQKYIWYNGWGSCKYNKGDIVEIEYEDTEDPNRRNIKKISLYNRDKNTRQTKEKTSALKTAQITTEIVPLVKIGRKSVVKSGDYQNETCEISIIYPTEEITPERIRQLTVLVENQLAEQIRGIWAFGRIDESVRKRIEEYVEKRLSGGEK